MIIFGRSPAVSCAFTNVVPIVWPSKLAKLKKKYKFLGRKISGEEEEGLYRSVCLPSPNFFLPFINVKVSCNIIQGIKSGFLGDATS